MSPACAERTEWLVDMLDRMADGLFDHLEEKMTRITDDFKGELRTYLLQRRKKNEEKLRLNPNKDWILVYDQAAQSRNYRCYEKSLQQPQAAPAPTHPSFLRAAGGALGLAAPLPSQPVSPEHRQVSVA